MRRRALIASVAASALIASQVARSAVDKDEPSSSLRANSANAKDSLVARLQNGSARFKQILAQAQTLNIQLAFTDLNAGSGTQYFRKDAEWFAPASLVKLPLAALLLERFEREQIDWQRISLAFPQMPECAANAPELRKPQRLTRMIERALVLSDDSAYCGLFDALGPHYLQQRLQALGYRSAHIQSRFGNCGPEQSRITGPVQIIDSSTKIEAARPAFSLWRAPQPVLIGKAWMRNGQLVRGAKDFSDSNHFALSELHDFLQRLIKADPAIKLSATARSFLLDAMRLDPSQSVYSNFSERKLGRTHFRLLAVGDGIWPKDLEVRNKVGWAYGFLSDMAYLKQGQRECLVSCVMYLNKDQVLNDGRYEYDSIGRPFMAELGRLLLQSCRERV
jgi:Beta-lactamase enzyme family